MDLRSIVFVLDNRVLAIEQFLIDANAFCEEGDPPPFAKLTDIPQGRIWDYVKLAKGFGGKGYAVKSNDELKAVLEELKTTADKHRFTLVAVNNVKKICPAT